MSWDGHGFSKKIAANATKTSPSPMDRRTSMAFEAVLAQVLSTVGKMQRNVVRSLRLLYGTHGRLPGNSLMFHPSKFLMG